MAQFTVDAFGATIGINCADDDLARLQEQWRRCRGHDHHSAGELPAARDDIADPSATAGPTLLEVEHLLDRGPADSARPSEESETAEHVADYSLATAVTIAAIQQLAGQSLLFHACGVAHPTTGAVIVLVAESGTGKTTASIRLCRAGWGYVSDETISVTTDLQIRPYPKPLSVVRDPAKPYEKSQHSPDELGMAELPDRPLTASAIVLLNRNREKRQDPCIERVDLIDAIVRLIPQMSALPSVDRPLASLAQLISSLGGCHELAYSEIEDADEALRSLLNDRLPVVPFEHLPPDERTRSKEPHVPVEVTELPLLVQRAAYLDAIADETHVLLLAGNQAVVLDGIGAQIWVAAHEPQNLPDLVSVCEESFGAHSESDALVADAVRTLLEHGALVEVPTKA